jgi:hypothetical protein
LENIDGMRELDIASKIECTGFYPFLQPFKTKSYLSLYTDKNNLNFLCLDKEGIILFEKKDLIKNKKIEEISKFFHSSSSFSNTVFICTWEKHLKQKKTLFYLRSFDRNFNLLAEIKLDKEPYDYGVNGENLFLLNINEKCFTMSMYNHNLEIVQSVGQENSILPFYFSPKIDCFLVSNQYLIINELIDEDDGDNDHNRVTIINRSNGLVESSFKIYENFHQMILYLDKFLITFNKVTCLLKCYNYKGDLLQKITLDKKLEGSLIGVINKELSFVLTQDDKFFII